MFAHVCVCTTNNSYLASINFIKPLDVHSKLKVPIFLRQDKIKKRLLIMNRGLLKTISNAIFVSFKWDVLQTGHEKIRITK